jgi:hypothetical protein
MALAVSLCLFASTPDIAAQGFVVRTFSFGGDAWAEEPCVPRRLRTTLVLSCGTAPTTRFDFGFGTTPKSGEWRWRKKYEIVKTSPLERVGFSF